uniref:ATP synthase complex subunit 8 n=1 Tax=Neohirasea stephanus TaxID=2982587 RepID=A0A977SQM3_9NEOP|nr:ATP synthase F0 subunit 8 [Neohirasea stephanus]UXO94153.1 ATP synthase F0 subunit 8 [Neohirasea stephanus]
MPQMAPMSWMIIYIYFMLIMMMYITKMYFTKNTYIKKSLKNLIEKKENNWKW